MNSVIRRATSVLVRQRKLFAARLLASEAASHGHVDYGGAHGRSLAEVLRDHRGTLNDLPVPAGSWEEANKKRQMGYNIVLAFSVVLLATTIFIMESTGTLYLHSRPDLKKVKINVD